MRYQKEQTVFIESAVRAALPNISLPETLLPEHVAEFGFMPYVEPPTPAPTPEQIQADIVARTQQRLDEFARTRNYDGILSACTYATDPNPAFAAEGQYCVALRSATWAALYAVLAEVQAGTRPMPSGFADVEPALPILTWPV